MKSFLVYHLPIFEAWKPVAMWPWKVIPKTNLQNRPRQPVEVSCDVTAHLVARPGGTGTAALRHSLRAVKSTLIFV